MKSLKKLIKTDIIKLKSSKILGLHLLVPALGILVFLTYYSFSSWDDYGKISGYLQILSVAFPTLIAVITSMLAEEEYMAGGFKNFLTYPAFKAYPLISKYLVSLALGLFSTLLAVMGFYLAYGFIGDRLFSPRVYFLITLILWGSNIFLYILHHFLSLRFSKNISLIVGIVESLVAALFLTGMGDGRWPFFPCSWSGRLVGYYLYSNFDSAYQLDGLGSGLVAWIFGLTFLGLVLSIVWFLKWEGERIED